MSFKNGVLEGQGSILDAPGLDFGGSWVDFSKIFAKKTKNINIKNLPRKDINHRFVGPPRVGGRRCSPPGGFNPPPTVGVRSVLDIQQHRLSDTSRSITKGESERPSRPRLLFPYLLLFPGGWGPPESTTKFPPSTLVGSLGLIFCSSETLFKIYIENNVKIEDFGLPKPSQNPPKTPPKSMFQKTSKFSSIFNRFLPLVAKAEP